MKNVTKIVLKGQVYAAPRTESVVVKNQGVLCGSAVVRGINLGVGKGGLN